MARKTQQDPVAALRSLLRVATEAADWMCEAREGTDQHERGTELRAAIAEFKAVRSKAAA